jgi:hypothetical protein
MWIRTYPEHLSERSRIFIIITIRTNECTQFHQSRNITAHQLLHVPGSLAVHQGAHSCTQQLLKFFCTYLPKTPRMYELTRKNLTEMNLNWAETDVLLILRICTMCVLT